MQRDFNKMRGRIGLIAAIVLALLAVALYLYSERAVPPEPGPDTPAETGPAPERPRGEAIDEQTSRMPPASRADATLDQAGTVATADGGNAAETGEAETSRSEASSKPAISLEREQQRLREDLAARLGPGQIEMVVSDRLLERLVATVNSLDGEPVPLRFRPLDHVPDLPRLEPDGDAWRLPQAPDPRYRPYRALFDRLSATELAELFDRYEPALERAWQGLGEHPDKRFRTRLIEVLNHLAEFELPAQRPRVDRPEVLYEYIDPELERLSWGRKALIRIGPRHAPAVQRKLGELADRLAQRSAQGSGN